MVADALGREKSLEIGLSASRMLGQGVVDEPSAGILVLHSIGRAHVGLVGQKDNHRSNLAISRLGQNLRRNLPAHNPLRRITALLLLLWVLGQGRGPGRHAEPKQHQENPDRAKNKTEQDTRIEEAALRRTLFFHKGSPVYLCVGNESVACCPTAKFRSAEEALNVG